MTMELNKIVRVKADSFMHYFIAWKFGLMAFICLAIIILAAIFVHIGYIKYALIGFAGLFFCNSFFIFIDSLDAGWAKKKFGGIIPILCCASNSAYKITFRIICVGGYIALALPIVWGLIGVGCAICLSFVGVDVEIIKSIIHYISMVSSILLLAAILGITIAFSRLCVEDTYRVWVICHPEAIHMQSFVGEDTEEYKWILINTLAN